MNSVDSLGEKKKIEQKLYGNHDNLLGNYLLEIKKIINELIQEKRLISGRDQSLVKKNN